MMPISRKHTMGFTLSAPEEEGCHSKVGIQTVHREPRRKLLGHRLQQHVTESSSQSHKRWRQHQHPAGDETSAPHHWYSTVQRTFLFTITNQFT